ncbi:hypothetical protein DER44DRAFT_764201 [Fusarium oxysporum]|nr:hypothetical protein DER44DRAFT_764201 [Fusarium oxysporum]
MADYPRQCPCCEKTLTSASDLKSHLLDLQSRVTVLIEDLCDGNNNLTLPAQRTPTRRKPSRTSSRKCPHCNQTFPSATHAERHRFTHYDWNRQCERCEAKHERASAYILHSCGKAKRPNSKEIHSRQRHVDDERSKVPSGLETLSMQEYSHTLWQESYM